MRVMGIYWKHYTCIWRHVLKDISIKKVCVKLRGNSFDLSLYFRLFSSFRGIVSKCFIKDNCVRRNFDTVYSIFAGLWVIESSHFQWKFNRNIRVYLTEMELSFSHFMCSVVVNEWCYSSLHLSIFYENSCVKHPASYFNICW